MRKSINKLSIPIISLLFSTGAIAAANETTIPKQYKQNLGGYTQIVIDTEDEQKNPLIKVTSIEIPSSIINTGQALNYVLYSTGYKLEDLRETSDEALELYSMRIPVVNRSFFRSTIEQIIQTLIGSAFTMQVNNVTRTITIEAKA